MKRLTTTKAAEVLGVGPDAVRAFAKAGYLKAVTSSGKTGNGQRFYFDADEVAAFARGGAPAAEAFRNQQDRPLREKKGRGRKAVTS